jgi:hypothetical protein
MAEDPSSINSDSTYSPATPLHIFNGLLAPAQTKKIIRLKGVYRAGKGFQGYVTKQVALAQGRIEIQATI